MGEMNAQQQAKWLCEDWALRELTGKQGILLLGLQGLANNVTHIVQVRHKRLAEVTGIQLSSLPTMLYELERKGFIQIEKRTKNWTLRSNRRPRKKGAIQYVLLWSNKDYYRYRGTRPDTPKRTATFSGDHLSQEVAHATPF